MVGGGAKRAVCYDVRLSRPNSTAILHNFDLHNHSTASDGLDSPAALMALAAKGQCDAVALTDHDTTAGLLEARNAASSLGLRLIDGVEISVTWPTAGTNSDTRPTTLHVLGLNIDPTNNALRDGLATIREGRSNRAMRMDASLREAGVVGIGDAAFAIAKNPDMISRTHFARAIVDRGIAKSTGAVFEKYLTTGKPGYVAHQWATLGDAVGWIRAANGVAVLAHPGRYRLPSDEMHALLTEFKQLGGAAIEIVTGSHQAKHTREFTAYAKSFGFLGSRGADYHGEGEGPYRPGELPPLPDSITPVWSLFA